MATKVIMPKQGLQMTEGTILQWFKKEGDSVNEGEPLFEIETDKLTIEIDAPAGGLLLKILNEEGDVVPITETIALIGEAGEDISSYLTGAPGNVSVSLEPAAVEEPVSDTGEPRKIDTAAAPRDRIFSTPRARWRAEESGIDLEVVAGSGPEGLVIERDVVGYAANQPAATPVARRLAGEQGVDLTRVSGTGPRGKIYSRDIDTGSRMTDSSPAERRPLKGMRKVIAQRMRSSLDTAAQTNHQVEVDMSEAVRLRSSLKKAGVKISFNDIILKTVASALRAMPIMRCSLQADEIFSFKDVHIGMAVALEEGLIVPVLPHVDRMGLEEIHEFSQDLGVRAREGKLMPEELTGAVFTVSNLGMYGLDRFTAIINEPESGILAVGAVKDKPVALNGQLEVRPMCSLTLTYDHRLVDGAPAAEFLMHIKKTLENPYLLLSGGQNG